MGDDRYALGFDSENESLGEIALRLLRLGIDVLYAQTADEAFLLANDEGRHIRAVIVPPSVEIKDLARVVERVDAARDSAQPEIVVVGDKPSDETRAALRSAGADRAVWSPEDERALRFALNTAMVLPGEIAPRKETRVPTNQMASFAADDSRGDAVTYTLSAKGAFLETDTPPRVGAKMQMEIRLPSSRVGTRARVAYVNRPGRARRSSWPIGMGVTFEDLDRQRESRLRRFIGERAESFQV